MIWTIVIATVVGLTVALLWPVFKGMQERRSPDEQPEVTDVHPSPPAHPDTPVPGSQEARAQHGRP